MGNVSFLPDVLGGAMGGMGELGESAAKIASTVVGTVGLKNIAGVGAIAAGALGKNSAIVGAGIGAMVGGKSTLATIALTGAGFAVGSMLDASSADDVVNAVETEVSSDIPQNSQPVKSENSTEISTKNFSPTALGGVSEFSQNGGEFEF